MKMISVIIAVSLGLLLAIAPVCGQTWTQTGANTNYYWGSIACSADGTKLVASSFGGGSEGVFLSTNSGSTWALCSGPGTADFLVSSANGTALAAVSGTYVYTSTNSGGSWTPTGPMSGTLQGLAMSADGRTLVAITASAGIYVSTNTGLNWILETNINTTWANAVCSANGTKLAAISDVDQPFAYVSTNSGTTWQKTPSFNENEGGEARFISTADGSKLMVEGVQTSYLSTNWGETWLSLKYNLFDEAGSADGSLLLGIPPGFFGSIYTSTNLGLTATSNSAPQAVWNAAACSADGEKLFAAAGSSSTPSTNGIWTLQLPPAPRVNISLSTGAINFSWIVPSTNMVLEESPDLNNWTTLTNLPSLDFTNLHEQLTLSATNGQGFFRLISQ